MMRMSDTSAESTDQEVEALPVEQPDETPDPHSLGLELPENTDEAIDLLLREVATARDEASSYLDDLKRVAADFDNYRKRTTRESGLIFERATEKVVKDLMPVLDSFDAAIGAEPASDTEKQLHSGMLNTREQLLDALKAGGLDVIPTIDETFDPEVHEPVGAPGGNGDLVVTEELRRGYRLNGKVLRAALVMVESSS